MLTLDQIKGYFNGELLKTNVKGMLVEYLQYELLDSLFKQKNSEFLCFIGGTAIRILHDSRRFSEDLDFDNYGLDFAGFKQLLSAACVELGTKGFAVKAEFSKIGEVFHAKLKFPEIFKQYGIPAHHQEKVLIKVDAEKKEKVVDPGVKTLNRFSVYRKINAAQPDVLLAQKLIAILKRKRERGRDFYDASFLSGLTKPNIKYIELKANMPFLDFKEKLYAKCKKLNFKILARDVSPFLFDKNDENRVLNFMEEIGKIVSGE